MSRAASPRPSSRYPLFAVVRSPVRALFPPLRGCVLAPCPDASFHDVWRFLARPDSAVRLIHLPSLGGFWFLTGLGCGVFGRLLVFLGHFGGGVPCLLFWFVSVQGCEVCPVVSYSSLFRFTGDPVVSIGSIGTPRCAVCLRLWVVSCPVVPACSSLWLVFAPVRLLSMFGSPSRAPFPASAVVLFFCPISVGYFRLDHSLPTCRVCVPDYSPAAPRSDREEVVGRVRWILKFSFAKPGATYRSPFFLRHGELCGVRSSSIRVASSASVSYFVAFSLCVYRWSMFSDSDSECYVSRVSCFHFERCNCACCMRPICSAC